MSSDVLSRLLDSIAGNVYRLRTEQRMTQDQLARAARISIRTVQSIEAAEFNVRASLLAQLAEALNVDPAALVTRAVRIRRRAGRPRNPDK